MIEIEFEKPLTLKSPWCRSLRMTTASIANTRRSAVGIDPGVNFGITFIDEGVASIYHGTLKKSTKPGEYAYIAYRLWCEQWENMKTCNCVIEGAAYHKAFGQVGLAEVRTGFYLACVLLDSFKSVSIVPPATIRKKVFQNHLQQAADVWPQLHHNAADSLSMAIYALTE